MLFPITEINLESVDSTNSFLWRKVSSLKEWTIVTAEHQTLGKGYGKSKWLSEKRCNLIFSIFIRPKCGIENIFYLNKAVANALHKSIYPLIFCETKWPNDLIINHKKAAGILIENRLLGKRVSISVIGVGLNVNQTDFKGLPKATSLKKEIGKELELSTIYYTIIRNIQEEYQLFKEKKFNVIDDYFNKHLYKKDKISVFKIENQLKNGIIRRSEKGKLLVEVEDEGIQSFDMKEIELLY